MNTEEQYVVIGLVNCFAETQNCQERERGLREALLGDARVKGIYVVNVPTDAEQAKLAAERCCRSIRRSMCSSGSTNRWPSAWRRPWTSWG